MTTNFRFVFLKSFTSGRLLKTKPGDELRHPLRMRNRIFVMSRWRFSSIKQKETAIFYLSKTLRYSRTMEDEMIDYGFEEDSVRASYSDNLFKFLWNCAKKIIIFEKLDCFFFRLSSPGYGYRWRWRWEGKWERKRERKREEPKTLHRTKSGLR